MPRSKPKRRRHKTSRLLKILSIGGLALLVVAILAFKEITQAVTPAEISSRSSEAQSNQMIGQENTAGSLEELPEAQLARAIQDGQPVLAFFHSNNCRQCVVMIDTVDQVYPEFADQVALVDIDVYDARNTKLMKAVRLQYIPTLIFYDRTGNGQVSVGAMWMTARVRRMN
jgi:thiol:disulfide interchange protein